MSTKEIPLMGKHLVFPQQEHTHCSPHISGHPPHIHAGSEHALVPLRTPSSLHSIGSATQFTLTVNT